jgi:hypothetical protein
LKNAHDVGQGENMSTTLTAIDVAIGLIFVYLLMSLMCSVLQEYIASAISWRGEHLRNGIKVMLNDPTLTGLAQRLYRHPRIATLSFPGKLPSYIPSVTFAKALADLMLEDNNFNASIDGPLAPFIKDAQGDIAKLQAEFTKWFDDSMDGLGGWYKRRVQIVLFLLGLGLAAVFNVNTLEIARALWTQPLLRDAVVQNADQFYKKGNPTEKKDHETDDTHKSDATDATKIDATKPDTTTKTDGTETPDTGKDERLARLQELQAGLDSLHLPIGWDPDVLACMFRRGPANAAPPPKPEPAAAAAASKASPGAPTCRSPQGRPGDVNLWWEWIALLAGWIVTAFATSLGTQFWFQTLGQALAIRAAGAKPQRADATQPSDTGQKSGTGA